MSSLFRRFVRWLVIIPVVGAALAVGIWFANRTRQAVIPTRPPAAAPVSGQPGQETSVVRLSPQARRNLGLVARPVRLETYWRKILVPGEIVDRPGVSDRGITAPAIGVVTQVHAFPGDTVRAGERLVTLRLVSEYIQNTQSELFKATRETELVQEQRDRLAAVGGAVPQARLLELDQQLRRLQAAIQGYRQDLLARGLKPEQIAEVTQGKFIASIEVAAPPALPPLLESERGDQFLGHDQDQGHSLAYEVQELKVDLGTQVQAGELLAVLANHRTLYVAGHAFRREAPSLEQAARQGWPITLEFAEDNPADWPPLDQTFRIRHLANAVSPGSRTFEFFIPLSNQSRTYEQDGRTFVVWRFHPGQRVRLHVPIAELPEVIVLPRGAVAREGEEAYVFRQNGDLFDRLPVRVLHEDRLHVVLANDGSVFPGWYLAQGGAASLSRVLKAQAASGLPAGVHVHADGTAHGAH